RPQPFANSNGPSLAARQAGAGHGRARGRCRDAQPRPPPRSLTRKTPAMTSRLEGKTAFLTAAGQGIGRATALAFAREGARVIATDIDESLLEKLAADARGIEVRKLNVRDAAAITATAQAVGAVAVLFHGAGFVHP